MSTDHDAIICTTRPLPYFGAVPQRAELVFYAVKGFEIPSLPALPPDYGAMRGELVAAILYRFRSYIAELHTTEGRRSIALQFMSHPEQSTLNARVRCTILCRSADPDAEAARRGVTAFVGQAMDIFPREGVFSYGSPVPPGRGRPRPGPVPGRGGLGRVGRRDPQIRGTPPDLAAAVAGLRAAPVLGRSEARSLAVSDRDAGHLGARHGRPDRTDAGAPDRDAGHGIRSRSPAAGSASSARTSRDARARANRSAPTV